MTSTSTCRTWTAKAVRPGGSRGPGRESIAASAIGAWQGSVSCLVQPDSDVANDTVTYTRKPPFTKASAADAASYAAKLGKVCTDVFAAAG